MADGFLKKKVGPLERRKMGREEGEKRSFIN
jgi:hypothetical protein